MSGGGADTEWPRLIASVAVRLGISSNEVRSMLWVDFREMMRCLGAKIKNTPQELQAEIERFIRG
jgi:hypothetical protein